MSEQPSEEKTKQQEQQNQQPKREGILKNGNMLQQEPYMRRVESAVDHMQRNRNQMPYQPGPYPIPVDNYQAPYPVEGNIYERQLPPYPPGQHYRQYGVRQEVPYRSNDQREFYKYKEDQYYPYQMGSYKQDPYLSRPDPRYFRPYERNPQARPYYPEYLSRPYQNEQRVQNVEEIPRNLLERNKEYPQQRNETLPTQPRIQERQYRQYQEFDYPSYIPRMYDQGPGFYQGPPPNYYPPQPRHFNTYQEYDRREFYKPQDDRGYRNQQNPQFARYDQREIQQYVYPQYNTREPYRHYQDIPEQVQDGPQYRSPQKIERVRSMYLSPQALEKLKQENARGRSFSPQTHQQIEGQMRNGMTPNPYRQYQQSNQIDRYDIKREEPRTFDSVLRRM